MNLRLGESEARRELASQVQFEPSSNKQQVKRDKQTALSPIDEQHSIDLERIGYLGGNVVRTVPGDVARHDHGRYLPEACAHSCNGRPGCVNRHRWPPRRGKTSGPTLSCIRLGIARLALRGGPAYRAPDPDRQIPPGHRTD